MADIYIDPSAASNGSGSSADDPYNSFTEMGTWNADMGGDTAFIKAGTTFRGRAVTQSGASNYNIMPYGDGDKPKLKASSLQPLTYEGDDIWFTGNVAVKASVFLDGEYVEYVTNKVDLTPYSVWQASAGTPIYLKVGPGENPNGSVEVATFANALVAYSPLIVRDIQVFHGYDTACQLRDLVDDVQLISVDGFWGGSPTGINGRNCFELKGTGVADAMAENVRVRYCTAVGAENNAFEIHYLDGAEFTEIVTGGSKSNEFELWKWIQNSTFQRCRTTGTGDKTRTSSSHFTRLFGFAASETTVGQNNGNTFKNNLARNGHSSAVVVEGYCDDNLFYNNDFINYGADADDSGEACGLQISAAANLPTGTEWKNNLIESTKAARLVNITDAGTSVAFDKNMWLNNKAFPRYRVGTTYYQTIGAWNTLTGGTDYWEDPGFDSEYNPSAENALSNGVTGLVVDDLNRLARATAPTLGAVEERKISQATAKIIIDI